MRSITCPRLSTSKAGDGSGPAGGLLFSLGEFERGETDPAWHFGLANLVFSLPGAVGHVEFFCSRSLASAATRLVYWIFWELQVEAMDSEPLHMQTHLDIKLSSMEIRDVTEISDSTEEMSKVPEELVKAPSEGKLLDHNLNGTASSLNGNMDEGNKFSNEQLHEDSKKDHEQIEAASDEQSADQNNKINKGVNECLSHEETTTEDSSLSKHGKEEEPKGYDNQGEDPMPDTLKTDSDIDGSQPVVVVDQLDHNMDPAKATDDTQPASMVNIPDAEVATEACAGVQSPLDANQDDSDAIQDTVDGSTEKDEAAREDEALHLEHRESFPENYSSTKHMEEVVKAEDQQSKQADATDADEVQKDIHRHEETGVSEEIHKSEHADESIIDVQEERHQETSEDTNGPACGEKEETSLKSSMAASDDTASEEPKGDDQLDEDPMPDTLKTESDVNQSQLVDQLDHNMDMAKATEDTQPASMANFPNPEVVTEACAGLQSPLDVNQDDSDAIQDTVDGSTEKDEVASEDGAIYLEHKKTDVLEEIPKYEHADEPVLDAQEECHQETSEDTNGPACGEKEQTSQQSSMATSDDTASEEPKGDDQLDEDPMLDTLKTEIEIDQNQVAVDQLDRNTDPEKETEDTPATMENIPNTEVVTEACDGVQSRNDANLNDSDAVRDTVDGITAKDEAARDDGTIHHEHRESFPDDTSMKHTEEVVKVEDQQSTQVDATDADVVLEDIIKCEETGVSEEIPESEHADEPIIDAQEELHQETSEDANGQQTPQPSSMSASEETASGEPKGDDQVNDDSMLDTLKTEIEIDQSQVAVDQQDHNTDPEKETEDTPATMENIPNTEVVTEACDGVQSHNDANLNDSDAVQDNVDGITAKDEAARDDGTIHHEHRESFPDDTSTKHTEEVVKVDDQQSTQVDATDADVVPEDIIKCEETGVSEEIPEPEHADEPIIDAQEELHQETSEDANGPACGEKEQTPQHSSMSASDETASEHDSTNYEPPVDIQVQNKELLDEMKDPEAVNTEAAMQQSCVPECHVPTIEQHSVEINSTEGAESHNVQTVPSSEEDKVENTRSTEEIMDDIAESIAGVTNAETADEANKEKKMLRAEDIFESHIKGIESEVSKSIEPVETEEDTDQKYVSLLDDSAQEDKRPGSEKHQMGSALEINETEATRNEAVPEESNASVHEKPSSEDYVTESGTTGDIKGENTIESLEYIESDNKDTQTREISGQSNMDSAGKSTEESNGHESEPTSKIQPEQEPESEEMSDTELAQGNKSSTEICATVFHKQTQENDPTRSELHVMESGVRNIEATEVKAAPNHDHPEEKATEETITSSEPQTQEPESVEKMNDNEANEPQNISQISIMSPSEEFVPEEIAKEDIVTIEPDECHHQPQDPEMVVLDTIETKKFQETASSGIVSNNEESILEDNVTVTEPDPETQAVSLRSAEVMEDTENVKGPGALAGEVAQEENLETEAILDISPVQEPELEGGKNTDQIGTENNITPSDLPAERMENETIPYESSIARIREVTENNILTAVTPPAGIQPVQKQESAEDKCNDTTEKLRETRQVMSSSSDEHIPAEDNTAIAESACEITLNNVVTQGIKESEYAKTDQFSNLGSFPSPGEAAEESNLARIETTSDVQEVQELDSTEETRGIEAMENDDHQQNRVSTLVPAVGNKPSVEDHQVHHDKTEELKDNETLETEQIIEQSNISTPDNAPEERSELGDDPDWCAVQPAHQLESSRESEDCKLSKEASDQKIVTLEDTATEDTVADEIDPPAGMEQEHEQKSVEEVKDISANEVKEDFHISQPDASDKLDSESNIATTDIQHVNDFETNEMKSIEGIEGGDSSCEQTEIATSVDSSPKYNEIAREGHPVESHEENLGNGTENAMLVHTIKDQIQTTVKQKDDAFDLDGTVTTADITKSSGEDTLESSNSTDQIKEGQTAGIGETVTERSTTESQASTENDAQASHITQKDDKGQSGEQTNDHRQAGDFKYQPQTSESSVDEKYVQKVILDKQHKKDEEFESQKEQLQADEQNHKDESDDISNEPLVESKNTENGTTNKAEETDTLEAGQTTEAAVNEILKIEQALHTSEDSTAGITDTTVENITRTDQGVEEENRPNSANTSNANAKMENQEDQENTGKDNIVPMDYTGAQGESDEITIEELEPGLASSVQEISYTAPSKDHILENDPIVVPYNTEPGGHQDIECTNKVNDDQLSIQKSEKETVAGMQENTEMQNEAKVVHHAEPYNVDTKIDDTTHNTTGQPRDIEQIGENKGLSSIDKPVEETSEQNNVEQHLHIHNKVEDERLESTELEATQQKVDISNIDTNNDGRMSMSNFITEHESESADVVLQLETEGNTFNKADETVSYEKTEASDTSVPETVTFNEEICDKVTGADGRLFDENLKTSDDTRRNLLVSSLVTVFNEESMNKEMEEHKLAVPAHLTVDGNTPKLEISVSEKPIPTKPEEQDDKIQKEQDEEDICKPDFSDDQKEVDQDLPVSNFLMNLILGKENRDANGHSEPEEETKQQEIRDDLVIPKQVESLVLSPTENNVEDKLAVKQEKDDVKCSEAPEVVEEQSHDLKLGTETSLDTDAETNKNSHHLELPPYQDKLWDEIYNETLSEKAAEVFTKTEAKGIAISNTEQDDREVDTPSEENTEPGVHKNGSLVNNLDDLNNTKTSEEDTLGEGQRGLLPECLNDARSVNSESEQTPLLSESGTIDAKCLSSEADSVQNPACEIQDKANESSNIEATSIPNIQVENKEDKIEDKQPATTATGSAEEHVETSNDNVQKSVGPEATSNGQESQIADQVSDIEIALSQEKENSEGSSSTVMDKKEDSDVSVKEGSSIQTAVEIEADDSNMQINQDKQEAADNKTVMESEKLDESNIQEQEGNDTQKNYSEEYREEGQHSLVKKETVMEEDDVHETVKSSTETEKIKYNDEQKSSDSKVQERDLNVFPPKEVPKPEESSVDKATSEFSTNDKQSPKVDELNVLEEKTYEGKTKDEEKIKNFADEAMKTEAQVAGQKAAHKKQNILSGVGSKVKRQLAKVKNVITGKPGHAKPESPRS